MVRMAGQEKRRGAASRARSLRGSGANALPGQFSRIRFWQQEGALGGIGDSRARAASASERRFDLGEIELAHRPHMTEMMGA
jgi:hypothetical protein